MAEFVNTNDPMKNPNTVEKSTAVLIIAPKVAGQSQGNKRGMATAVAWLGLSATVMATPVTVPDFSFENTVITPGGTSVAPNVGTNWTASGNGGCYLQDITNTLFTPPGSGTLPPTADGTNYLVENMNGHTAYCWQNVGLLQSNTIYTLSRCRPMTQQKVWPPIGWMCPEPQRRTRCSCQSAQQTAASFTG